MRSKRTRRGEERERERERINEEERDGTKEK